MISTFNLSLLLWGMGMNSAYGVVTIKDDNTGGQCQPAAGQPIGIWNAASKTCTLLIDVHEGMVVADDGITIDGSRGVAVDGNNSNDRVGIELKNRKNVTIQNVIVTRFEKGILVFGGSNNKIVGNNVHSMKRVAFQCGICLEQTTNNKVSSNHVHDNNVRGIMLITANANNVLSNIVSNNDDSNIYLGGARNNNFYGNTVDGGTTRNLTGIRLWGSFNNRFIFNKISGHINNFGFFTGGSRNNLVMFNDFKNNGWGAMEFATSNNNYILCNDTANDNGQGVKFRVGSARNSVVMNNFYQPDNGDDANPPNTNQFINNYWQINPACPDANNDGICDVPYNFPVGQQDPLPYLRPIPWKINPLICFSHEPTPIIDKYQQQVEG